MNYSDGHKIERVSNRDHDASHKRTYGMLNCMTGRSCGEPLAPEPDLLMAVTEWVAMHDGKARFRRRRGNDGIVRLGMLASAKQASLPKYGPNLQYRCARRSKGTTSSAWKTARR
jgi:hypothetical protein